MFFCWSWKNKCPLEKSSILDIIRILKIRLWFLINSLESTSQRMILEKYLSFQDSGHDSSLWSENWEYQFIFAQGSTIVKSSQRKIHWWKLWPNLWNSLRSLRFCWKKWTPSLVLWTKGWCLRSRFQILVACSGTEFRKTISFSWYFY